MLRSHYCVFIDPPRSVWVGCRRETLKREPEPPRWKKATTAPENRISRMSVKLTISPPMTRTHSLVDGMKDESPGPSYGSPGIESPLPMSVHVTITPPHTTEGHPPKSTDKRILAADVTTSRKGTPEGHSPTSIGSHTHLHMQQQSLLPTVCCQPLLLTTAIQLRA